MEEERDTLTCDITNRCLIMKGKVIHLPPGHFILYLYYLKSKKYRCQYPGRASCKDCTACFEPLFQTAKSTDQLLSFYKQIYGEYSGHYQTLKMKLEKGKSLSHKTLLQNISKINRKIKSHLKEEADPYMISGIGTYGNKVYGVKLDRNKITIIEE